MTTPSPAAKSVYRLPLMNRILTAFFISLAFFFPMAIGAYLLTKNEFLMFVTLAIVHTLLFLLFFKVGSSVSLAISLAGI